MRRYPCRRVHRLILLAQPHTRSVYLSGRHGCGYADLSRRALPLILGNYDSIQHSRGEVSHMIGIEVGGFSVIHLNREPAILVDARHCAKMAIGNT